MTAAEYLTLLEDRHRWIASVYQHLSDANTDTLLMPTVPVVAPPIALLRDSDELYGATNLLMLRNPTLINFLDGCALSLPCHKLGEAPVGLTLAAGHEHDERMLALHVAVEAALAQCAEKLRSVPHKWSAS